MLTRKLICRQEVALVESQAPLQRWFHTMRSFHYYTAKKGIGEKGKHTMFVLPQWLAYPSVCQSFPPALCNVC